MSFTVSVSLYQKETWMGRIAWPAFAWLGLDLLAHSYFANHGCPILWRRKLPTSLFRFRFIFGFRSFFVALKLLLWVLCAALKVGCLVNSGEW